MQGLSAPGGFDYLAGVQAARARFDSAVPQEELAPNTSEAHAEDSMQPQRINSYTKSHCFDRGFYTVNKVLAYVQIHGESLHDLNLENISLMMHNLKELCNVS